MINRTKILITGASSSIGRVLINELSTCDRFHLIVLSRNPSSLPKLENVEYLKIDIGTDFKLTFEVDILVHIAAETPGANFDVSAEKLERYEQVNVKGTERIIHACMGNSPLKILYVSSHAVVDLAEKDGTILDPYALSKARAENLVISSLSKFQIIRPTGVLSPPYWKQHLKAFASLKSYTIDGNGDALRQYVYYEDVADFLLKIIEQDAFEGEVLYLGAKVPFSERELIQRMIEVTGSQIVLKERSVFFSVLRSLLKDLVTLKIFNRHSNLKRKLFSYRNFDVDCSRANSYGFNPCTLEESLSRIWKQDSSTSYKK